MMRTLRAMLFGYIVIILLIYSFFRHNVFTYFLVMEYPKIICFLWSLTSLFFQKHLKKDESSHILKNIRGAPLRQKTDVVIKTSAFVVGLYGVYQTAKNPALTIHYVHKALQMFFA